MGDDLASSHHDISSLLGLATEVAAPAIARSPSKDAEGEEVSEGEAPYSASAELQRQLTALSAELLEAQRLRDHWHSQYTAQVLSQRNTTVRPLRDAYTLCLPNNCVTQV